MTPVRPTFSPDFAKRGGLLPTVVQDATSREILMVASVNQQAWEHTWATGHATFWSTSRNELWEKGLTSGDTLTIVEVLVDCDLDSLVFVVERGDHGACHTRNASGRTRSSCFYRKVSADGASLITLDP